MKAKIKKPNYRSIFKSLLTRLSLQGSFFDKKGFAYYRIKLTRDSDNGPYGLNYICTFDNTEYEILNSHRDIFITENILFQNLRRVINEEISDNS